MTHTTPPTASLFVPIPSSPPPSPPSPTHAWLPCSPPSPSSNSNEPYPDQSSQARSLNDDELIRFMQTHAHRSFR